MLKSKVNVSEKDRSWELPQKKKIPSIYNKSVYTVTWYNYDGEILEIDSVARGDIPVYKGTSPIKEGNSEYTYRFVGWSSSVEPITCNTGYTAVFGEIPNVPYLTFSSPQSFTFNKISGTLSGTLESSVDGVTWTTVNVLEEVSASKDSTDRLFKLYLRGTGNTVLGGNSKRFRLEGTNISIIGNIETLLDYQTVIDGGHPEMGSGCMQNLFKDNNSITSIDSLLLPATLLSNKCYYGMFNNTSITRVPPDLLPATTLANYCYSYMFDGCTSLTSIPSDLLPATTLNNFCYEHMFRGCTSLAIIPSDLLPATTLANGCYQYMFNGCTSLTAVPSGLLPAAILATQCYSGMFKGCILLTTIPKNFLPGEATPQACYFNMFKGCISLFNIPKDLLPSQVVGYMSYSNMFEGCTSLTTVPSDLLPATALDTQCYQGMFQGCTSLTNAPELPATTIKTECYHSMFEGCTSLTTVPSDLLPATTLENNCYYSMFQGCTSLTNAPELPATTIKTECYHSMFEGCISLTNVPELPATILAKNCYHSMFKGCTGIRLSETQTGGYYPEYRIPAEGEGTPGDDSLVDMFAGTSGTFTGTPEINTTYYLYTIHYLTFSAPNKFTLKTHNESVNWDGILEYSIDRFNWTTWDGTEISSGLVNGSNDIYLRGSSNTRINGTDSYVYQGFVFTGSDISIIGNIETLLDYQTVLSGNHPTMGNKCYMSLFEGQPIISVPSNLLPATTLVSYCYDRMFSGCTSLTTIPSNLLPATTVSYIGYSHMFQGCTSLTTVPSDLLPATTLEEWCYDGMFQGCTSLTNAPELPATSLKNHCYQSMFSGCTSLITAPELPATKAITECYDAMFRGCTSLTGTPAGLSSLANVNFANCCRSMFEGCTNLETLPLLNASKLGARCYASMFYGCTKIKLSEVQTEEYATPYRIPAVSDGTAGTGSLTNMFMDTGGEFKGTPSINTVYYTSNTIV